MTAMRETDRYPSELLRREFGSKYDDSGVRNNRTREADRARAAGGDDFETRGAALGCGAHCGGRGQAGCSGQAPGTQRRTIARIYLAAKKEAVPEPAPEAAGWGRLFY